MISEITSGLVELGVNGWPAVLFVCLAYSVRRLWLKQDLEAKECQEDRVRLDGKVDAVRKDLDGEKELRRDLEVKLVKAEAPCGIPECPRPRPR